MPAMRTLERMASLTHRIADCMSLYSTRACLFLNMNSILLICPYRWRSRLTSSSPTDSLKLRICITLLGVCRFFNRLEKIILLFNRKICRWICVYFRLVGIERVIGNFLSFWIVHGIDGPTVKRLRDWFWNCWE